VALSVELLIEFNIAFSSLGQVLIFEYFVEVTICTNGIFGSELKAAH
jgi:hypothetical protein